MNIISSTLKKIIGTEGIMPLSGPGIRYELPSIWRDTGEVFSSDFYSREEMERYILLNPSYKFRNCREEIILFCSSCNNDICLGSCFCKYR